MRLTRFDFYPRSPCGERHTGYCFVKACETFLSTLSLRRATTWDSANCDVTVISIHALLAESDAFPAAEPVVWTHFYPRSPCGERPGSLAEVAKYATISIHALLAESDSRHYICPQNRKISIHALLAESDSSCRPRGGGTIISIHALLAESDKIRPFQRRFFRYFYPRSPCGERPSTMTGFCRSSTFLSTLSLRRATGRAQRGPLATPHFYPRSPCGERQCARGPLRAERPFLSTLCRILFRR